MTEVREEKTKKEAFSTLLHLPTRLLASILPPGRGGYSCLEVICPQIHSKMTSLQYRTVQSPLGKSDGDTVRWSKRPRGMSINQVTK
jgi:hypothetical protein